MGKRVKAEEQVVEPNMDTKLGLAADRFKEAITAFDEAEEELESSKTALLLQMKSEGLDKIAVKGEGFKLTVRHEHVEEHDKLKYTRSSGKEDGGEA